MNLIYLPNGTIDICTKDKMIRFSSNQIVWKRDIIKQLFSDKSYYNEMIELLEKKDFFYPSHISIKNNESNLKNIQELTKLIKNQ